MNKTLLVGIREVRQRARSRGFLLSSIAMPLMLIVIWGFTGAFDTTADNPLEDLAKSNQPDRVIGYVDKAGLIQMIPDPVPPDLFQSFANVSAADTALERGDIGAFYEVPSDYRQTGKIQRVSLQLPTGSSDPQWFDWILIANLLPDASPEEIARLRWPFNSSGPRFVSLAPEGGAEGATDTMLPFLVAMAVMLPLFTTGGYLLQTLAQEKDNRVMEILLGSLRPRQLLTGKLLGLGALTVIQYAFWMIIGALSLTVTGRQASQLLSGISLTINEIVLVLPYALGGFALYATLMAGIGALSPDLESSRGWVFVISLPMLVPIYLWSSIAGSPNGSLAISLSLIPFSAPVAMLMRMTSTIVPAWQLTLSLLLLALTAYGMVRLIARLFRVQTLLSGEALSLGRAWAAFTE